MRETVLLDLGNTLVRYYTRAEFPALLAEAVASVGRYLAGRDLPTVREEEIRRRVAEENREGRSHRVRPLAGRLTRIFGLDGGVATGEVQEGMCRDFLGPIFALGKVYEDAPPALERLREAGLRTAIVSNTPWGSPGGLWREELERLGLDQRVEAAFFCTDAGWRKPAPQLFEFVLDRLGTTPERCIFVGDDPRWDVVGPRAVGIDAVLLDRSGRSTQSDVQVIEGLLELGRVLGVQADGEE
ncbi:MAG: HAD family hydrolase [Candidatus Brocadiaceae bacterium]|jgi:putative hydrolase of the HAD superfamily